MRNCFIPKCDALNKHNPSRTMFNVPFKDPELLSRWQQILPKHRPLKKFDRICVCHFRDEDIVRFWENKINGQIELIPRDKPTLKADAVPVYEGADADPQHAAPYRARGPRKTPAKRKAASSRNSGSLTNSDQPENTPIEPESAEPMREDTIVETTIHRINTTVEGHAVEHNITIEVLAHPDFETLYDEVYEVELPSTLWGIHRDLEKTFIAFTEFNKESMNIRKYLYVDQCLQYRMAVGQRIMKTGALATASTEAVTELLAYLDRVKVRKVIIKGSSSVLNEC